MNQKESESNMEETVKIQATREEFSLNDISIHKNNLTKIKSKLFLLWICSIISFIVFLWLLSSYMSFKNIEHNDICQLKSNKPNFNPFIENIITSDFKAIANFDGYLVYYKFPATSNDTSNDYKVYMPLKLKHLNLVDVVGGKQILTLDCNCANIELIFDVEKLEEINLTIRIANGAYSTCRIDNKNLATKQNDKSKNLRQSYTCYHNSLYVLVLQLEIYRLEYQINGDSEIIKNKNFQPQVYEQRNDTKLLSTVQPYTQNQLQQYKYQYNIPSYLAPSYLAPSYQAPSYQAPSYQTPLYQAPSYQAPSYQTPLYEET